MAGPPAESTLPRLTLSSSAVCSTQLCSLHRRCFHLAIRLQSSPLSPRSTKRFTHVAFEEAFFGIRRSSQKNWTYWSRPDGSPYGHESDQRWLHSYRLEPHCLARRGTRCRRRETRQISAGSRRFLGLSPHHGQRSSCPRRDSLGTERRHAGAAARQHLRRFQHNFSGACP